MELRYLLMRGFLIQLPPPISIADAQSARNTSCVTPQCLFIGRADSETLADLS